MKPLIQTVCLDDFQFSPYNPRIPLKPGDLEYENIERSIDEFGILGLPVVNIRTHHVLSGEQRIKVFKAKGITHIEAFVVDFSLEKEKAANIAMNKVGGIWDKEKLAALLDELSKIPDFDVSLSGFTMPEISQLLDRYKEVKDGDDFDFAGAVDSIVTPVTKKGDLIELGSHRILCGDSSNLEDFKTLMGNEKADLLDCDFPYNVNYGGGEKPNPNTRPKKSRKWPQIYSDNMPQPEYEAWMKKVLKIIKQYLKPGAAIYIWQGLRQFPPMYQILLDLDFHTSCFLIWLKESAAITYADYCYRTEQCLYGWLNGAPHYWAGKPGESNVWEVRRDPTKNYIHPTQKPVELAAKVIQNSSKRGDIILDTFLGSASVLIACESLGRRCYGLELDPRFVDGLVLRYINYVGVDKISEGVRDKYLKEETNASR
jgi:DNA modification methylase